jgi:hypothetical protein
LPGSLSPEAAAGAVPPAGTMLMPFLVLTVVTVLTGGGSAGVIAAVLTGSTSEVSTAAASLPPRRPVRKSADGTASTRASPVQARPQVSFELSLIGCVPVTLRPHAQGALEAKNMAIL